jgi:hypothetical protein
MEGEFSPNFQRWCQSRELPARHCSRRIVNQAAVRSSLESCTLDLSFVDEQSAQAFIESGRRNDFWVK